MKKIGVGGASITDLEKKYVLSALESERLSQGEFVAEFERRFSRAHGKKHGVMCNSGTSALHIALETLKETENWNEKTEVLVPAITFIATSNAVMHAGMRVVFVDVDPETYNIDPTQIEKHITRYTKCIMPVHTFGMPCEMEEIMRIAVKNKLKVIEDCAEAHFAKTDGKSTGSFGDISCFSTYVAHTITTGVGGIACTNNSEYAAIMRSFIAHGRACTCERCVASDSDSVCPKRMTTEIDRRFLFVRNGYSYRIGEIEGALGLAQLERKEEIMEKRRKNAQYLIEGLEKYESLLQLPRQPEKVEHTYMMFPIVIKENAGIEKKELIEFLERNNIETRPMLSLLNQPIYQRIFGDIESDYPNAKYINHNGFYIGCHHGLELCELKKVLDAVELFLKNELDKKCEEVLWLQKL